jgi:DNA-binding MarR family transcriptional regulator
MGDAIDLFFSEWSTQKINIPPLTEDMQYIYRIARVSRILGERLDATCSFFGITRSQFEAMAVLRRRHPTPLSANEIMQASMLSSGSVTPMIKQLTMAGLVERKQHAEDGRRIDISLTEKGIELIESALSERITDNKQLSELMPADERHQLNDLMRKFLTSLESLEEQTCP